MPDRLFRALGISLVACALVACALVACARALPTPTVERAVQGNGETFRLAGSTSAVPLIDTLADAFQKQHPGVILAPLYETHNSAQVKAGIAEGSFLLAAVAGAPSSDQGSADQGSDESWSAPIAVDALAVIVHADNPLRSLTLAQLYHVFVGRTWRWSELGVQVIPDGVVDDEIVVVSREMGSGTRAAFEDLALRERPDLAPTAVTTMAVLRLSSAEVVAYVSEHPSAIGYVALGALDARAEVKAIAIEDVAPSPQNVAGGAYRLSLPLLLIAPQEPTGAARQFVDFCLSPAGQAIVARRYVRVRE